MEYKVMLNDTFDSDCELCVFREKCNQSCPLELGWYFGNDKDCGHDILDVWDENNLNKEKNKENK